MDKYLYSKYKGAGYKGPSARKLKSSIAHAPARPFVFPVKLLKLAGALVLLLALAYGGYRLYREIMTSESFALKKVTISGNKYVSKNEILSMAKLEPGKNMFSSAIKDARERLQKNAQFEKVSVSKVFPSTVEITVKERLPAVFIGEDRKLQASSDGIIFQSLKSQVVGKKLYVITGIKLNSSELGKKSASRELTAALEMAVLLEKMRSPYLSGVTTIDADELEEIRLVCADGRFFKVGYGNWEDKLDRLCLLLKSLNERRENVLYVDMRFRDEAAVMFRK